MAYNVTSQLRYRRFAGIMCLQSEAAAMLTVDLGCPIRSEVPMPVPLPTRYWFRNGQLISTAQSGQDLDPEMSFLDQFPIFNPMVFDIPPFQILSANGQVVITTEYNNITNAMLGMLPPGTTVEMTRAMVFNSILGNWTCVANNTLGESSVQYLFRICGECSCVYGFLKITIGIDPCA